MVHETRSHALSSGNNERMVTRKQKAEAKAEAQEPNHSPKKAKTENEGNGKEEVKSENGKSNEDIKAEFEKFCKAMSEHLSIRQMREILASNGQDESGSDDAVVPRCQDMLFYAPLDKCPVCDSALDIRKTSYHCTGSYSEWSTCTYSTTEPPRKNEPVKFPDSVKDTAIDWLRKHQGPENRAKRTVKANDKPFMGMTISLSGRLTRTHQFWKRKIEKHGGKVSSSVNGAICLVVSSAERDRGGSSKLAEAMEKNIPVIREAWLRDSIDKNEAQPLGAYDIATDLKTAGGGIPLYQLDESEEALETVTAELKVYGKRGVHKDSKLANQGGEILEKDGILYNCAFCVSDRGRDINEFCIMQLISVPENRLYMYYKKGRIGDDGGAEEGLDEWENVDDAIKEFAKRFEGLTGNEFLPWEKEKKIEKKAQMFFPIDIDDGVEVRHGGLGLRQLGVAAAHCKLEPRVANFVKVLCGQEIYRYALMEMGLDVPDLPLGIVTDLHIRRCEQTFLEFLEKLKAQHETGQKREALWSDLSQRIFTLLPSTRPYVFCDYYDVADHAAASIEAVRDICVASRAIGDMSGSTLDDPLFERYKKLGCSISPLENDDDYKMIVKYLQTTYEPVKVGEISYGVSVESVFAVEVGACPSFDEIKKLPNKVLLWCGTRSSNLLRHLQKGFLPAICSMPVPGYMFGKAIVCSDASAEAARYGFTAVDRPEGFLVLAVASLGDEVVEVASPPEDVSSLERKKVGVIGRGRKKTDEKEHFEWKDGVKVPCGPLVPSVGHEESALEYNEYAVYDPKQVCIRFVVGVKFEEESVEYEVGE